MVVEDDHALREFYRNTLKFAGYAVIAVEDGVDALHHIENAIPSLVILDLGLPRLGGRDVQKEMKAHRGTHAVPIVVVTGDTRDLDPSDFACILRKPVTAEQLLQAVEKCLHDHPSST